MKVCIAMDSDGHFMAVKLENRVEVIRLLKNIYDGDYWYDVHQDCLDEFDCETEEELEAYILKANDLKWVDFVKTFEERGTMEIIVVDV